MKRSRRVHGFVIEKSFGEFNTCRCLLRHAVNRIMRMDRLSFDVDPPVNINPPTKVNDDAIYKKKSNSLGHFYKSKHQEQQRKLIFTKHE